MITSLFKKLNLKDHSPIYILNAPPEFEASKNEISKIVAVKESISKNDTVPFVLSFVFNEEKIAQTMSIVSGKLLEDAVYWIAFPKKSSKKYTTEISRDTGWAILGENGFEAVRNVAIDDDWSTIRFRHVSKIKTMTRDSSWAMTKEGKEKSAKKK